MEALTAEVVVDAAASEPPPEETAARTTASAEAGQAPAAVHGGPPSATGASRQPTGPPANIMTSKKWQQFFNHLLAKDYWDFSKGLPARGELHLFDILWRKMDEEDPVGWKLNPLSSYGKKALAGKDFQGGAYLQYLRKFARAKWEATVGSTGSGCVTVKAASAHKWLEKHGILQLSQQLFAPEKVRGRAESHGTKRVSAVPIDLTCEAGGVQAPSKKPAFGLANFKTWGGSEVPIFTEGADSEFWDCYDPDCPDPNNPTSCAPPFRENKKRVASPGQQLISSMNAMIPNMDAMFQEMRSERVAAAARAASSHQTMMTLMTYLINGFQNVANGESSAQQQNM